MELLRAPLLSLNKDTTIMPINKKQTQLLRDTTNGCVS